MANMSNKMQFLRGAHKKFFGIGWYYELIKGINVIVSASKIRTRLKNKLNFFPQISTFKCRLEKSSVFIFKK